MDEHTRNIIQKAVKDNLKKNNSHLRKSQLEGNPKEEGRDVSISKYLRGAIFGIWKEADVEKEAYYKINKELHGGVGSAGGFLIPQETTNEVIELLKAKAVVRGLGASIYPVTGDSLTFGRQTGAASGNWVGTTGTKTASDQSFGQLELVLKEYAALTEVRNALLEDASPAVDTIVRDDLATELGLAEDLAFLQGTGGLQPLGLINDPDVGGTVLGTGNGATPTFDDFYDAMYAIEAANGTYTGWAMHPRTKNTVRKLKDADGNYIYRIGDRTQGEPDTLHGLPVALTTQIPVNLTVGNNSDCSYVILGNWPKYAIIQKAGQHIKMDASSEAGDAFKNNETWFRASLRVDGGARQPDEFYVIRGVRP